MLRSPQHRDSGRPIQPIFVLAKLKSLPCLSQPPLQVGPPSCSRFPQGKIREGAGGELVSPPSLHTGTKVCCR